jgi:hypothetical protein
LRRDAFDCFVFQRSGRWKPAMLQQQKLRMKFYRDFKIFHDVDGCKPRRYDS